MAEPQPRDDTSIPDTADLWRRIPPVPSYTLLDQNTGRQRPTSLAFTDGKNGEPMSVFIAAEAGDPSMILHGNENYGLVAIKAGVVRACNQMIVRDPLPDAPWHAVVIGNKSHAVRSQLAKAAESVQLPGRPGPLTPNEPTA